jgi:ribosomal protein S17E
LVTHKNRDVKENASEVFERYIDSLAEKLDEDENRHKVKKIFILFIYFFILL